VPKQLFDHLEHAEELLYHRMMQEMRYRPLVLEVKVQTASLPVVIRKAVWCTALLSLAGFPAVSIVQESILLVWVLDLDTLMD